MFSHAILIQLMPDIFCYVCIILTDRIHMLSRAPEPSIAILTFLITSLFIYHQSAFAFPIPHESSNAHFSWYGKEHMDMILATFRINHTDALPFTRFSQSFTKCTPFSP